MKTIITILIFGYLCIYSLGIDLQENYQMTKNDSLEWLNNYIDQHRFIHDKRLQDAGNFESFKPTPEQERKYKLIKWESDKYNGKP